MHQKLTILTTTHYKASAHRICADYPANHDRKFTDTNLIETTINSLYNKINYHDLQHIISLDHDDSDAGSVEYYTNLCKLMIERKNIKLSTTTQGIYNSIKNLISLCKTPYYLFWEHDWELIENFDIKHIIDAFDKYDDINYIRLNKRQNIVAVGDTKLETAKYNDISLLKTNCWSNNPYFGRTSKMLEWFKMMDESHEKFHPTIELFLQEKMRQDNKDWGVYIYGKLNDGPRIKHLNGRER